MGYYYKETRLERESIIDAWWDSLEWEEQEEVVSDAYPDEPIEANEDELWNRLPSKRRWQIYLDCNEPS